MRVLIVTGIFPPDIGGPATYVPLIAGGLASREHEVTVLTLGKARPADSSEYAYTVVRVPRGGLRALRWLRTAIRIMQLGRKADVIYVNGLAKESALANLPLRKPMAVKVVGDQAWESAVERGWTTDGFEDFQRGSYGPRVELLKWVRRWWTRRANRIISNSAYMASWAEAWGARGERVAVVHNAADPVEPGEIDELPLQAETKLVTVGRLVSWKHVAELVEIVASVEGVGLTVVGDGPEFVRIQRKISELNVTDRVFMAGSRSRAETAAFVAASDIFVLNSSWESFAHVVVEAMQLGVPVIATATGGPRELIEDGVNGLLVGPEHRTMAEAVQALIDDETLATNLVEAGHAAVRDKFGVELMVQRTERVLADAFEAARSPA